MGDTRIQRNVLSLLPLLVFVSEINKTEKEKKKTFVNL